MAETVQRVTIEMILKDLASGPSSQVKAALEGIGKAAQVANKKASTASGRGGLLGTIIGTATGVTIGNIVSRTVGMAISAGKHSIAAAREAEQSASRLTVALDGNQSRMTRIQETAGNIAKKSAFDDDQLVSVAESLLERGVAFEAVPKAMQTIADTASALNQPLDQVAKQIATTFGGTVPRELASAVPALKNLSEEALRSGAAVDVLAKAYGGWAEKFLGTEAGKEAAALRDIEQAWEDIGTAMLPIARTLLPEIADLMKSIGEGAKWLRGESRNWTFAQLGDEVLREIGNRVGVQIEVGTPDERGRDQAKELATKQAAELDAKYTAARQKREQLEAQIADLAEHGDAEVNRSHAESVAQATREEYRARIASVRSYLDAEERITLEERKRTNDQIIATQIKLANTIGSITETKTGLTRLGVQYDEEFAASQKPGATEAEWTAHLNKANALAEVGKMTQVKLAGYVQAEFELRKKILGLTEEQQSLERQTVDRKIKGLTGTVAAAPAEAAEVVDLSSRGLLSPNDAAGRVQSTVATMDAMLADALSKIDGAMRDGIFSEDDGQILSARLRASADDAKERIEEAVTGVQSIKHAMQDIGQEAFQASTTGLATAITNIELRAQSAREALISMVQGFAQSMLQVINQKLTERLIGGLINIIGGAFGGAAAGPAPVSAGNMFAGGSSFGTSFSGASGGYTGDIHPTKVAGVVHGREYVSNAETVRDLGVGFFEKLATPTGRRAVKETARADGYATGGYVGNVRKVGEVGARFFEQIADGRRRMAEQKRNADPKAYERAWRAGERKMFPEMFNVGQKSNQTIRMLEESSKRAGGAGLLNNLSGAGVGSDGAGPLADPATTAALNGAAGAMQQTADAVARNADRPVVVNIGEGTRREIMYASSKHIAGSLVSDPNAMMTLAKELKPRMRG